MDHPKFFSRGGDVFLNFGDYGQEVEIAAFSGDGTRVLTVQEVGVAKVWDVASGQQVGEIRPNSPLEGSGSGPTTGPFQLFIEAAALDSAGQVALLGLNDGTAGLFPVADGMRRTTFHHPDRPPASRWELVRAVSFSPDGSLAAVGFYGRCVGIWSVPSGQPVAFLDSGAADRLHRPGGWQRDTLVSSVALSADNRFVFAGHADMTATLWDPGTGQVVFDAYEHQEEILALWQGSNHIRWATSGGKVWEAAPEGVAERLATGESWQEASFAPDGNTLLVRTHEERVERWSLSGEQELLASLNLGERWIGFASSVRTLAFAPGGQAWVFPTSRDRLALADATGVRPLHGSIQSVQSVFSPDGSRLATFDTKCLRVWAVPSGELLGELIDAGTFWSAAFSPDSLLLAASTLGQVGLHDLGPARTISLWSVAQQRLICCWPAHDHQVLALSFLPDSQFLASASLDRTVRLWELSDQDGAQPREAGRLHYEDLNHEHLHALSDGRLLIFRDRQIEVWRMLREKLLDLPVAVKYDTRWQVSPDQRSLLVTRRGQVVDVWCLESGRLLARLQADIARPDVIPDRRLTEQGAFTAGGYLWRTIAGNLIHVGDGPRGWATPLRLSVDSKLVILPCPDRAALVALDREPRIVTEFAFEGRLRASCIARDCVLALNSVGKVFAPSRG
jgi:WD40 repeat protein